jgi:hypothetical protein
MTSQVEELWRDHQAAAFPAECRSKTVDGIDLIMLDADTAGCVSTFLSRGTLDPWRLAALGICYRDLAVAARALVGEPATYYARLEELAGLVLRRVLEISRRA